MPLMTKATKITTAAKSNPATNFLLRVTLLGRRRGSNLEDRIFHPSQKCPGAECSSRHSNHNRIPIVGTSHLGPRQPASPSAGGGWMGRLTLHPRIAPSSPASSPSGLARVERRDLGVVFKSPGTAAPSPLFVTGILRTWAGHEPFCRREACFKPGLLARCHGRNGSAWPSPWSSPWLDS
jgi:hypothetical protein